MSDAAVQIDSISKEFRLPHKQTNSIKEKVVHLSFRSGFEIQKALKNVSLEINKGEFFGIVGRNGSGKSTLLKCIAGVYQPTKGSIQVNGLLTPFIELGVGFNPELSGRGNVFLNGALLGFSRKEIREKYDEIVNFAELGKFMDQKLKNYSSGMQVRLAFSIATQVQADILLLDEVLAVGDANFQKKCLDYFAKVKDQSKTIVLVTHDMSIVERFCDRAAFMKDGKIVDVGLPIDIANQYVLDNVQSARSTRPGSHIVRIESVQGEEKSSKVELDINYELLEKQDIYFGYTLIRDGAAIAARNSYGTGLSNKKGKHAIKLKLDKSLLLKGEYEINISVYEKNQQQLLNVMLHAFQFTINDHVEEFEGAVKINADWIESGS